jgi:hypothetical protein
MEKNYFLLTCLMVIRRKWITPQKNLIFFYLLPILSGLVRSEKFLLPIPKGITS